MWATYRGSYIFPWEAWGLSARGTCTCTDRDSSTMKCPKTPKNPNFNKYICILNEISTVAFSVQKLNISFCSSGKPILTSATISAIVITTTRCRFLKRGTNQDQEETPISTSRKCSLLPVFFQIFLFTACVMVTFTSFLLLRIFVSHDAVIHYFHKLILSNLNMSAVFCWSVFSAFLLNCLLLPLEWWK